MIESNFDGYRLRKLFPLRKKRIVALFSYRFDAHLIPDMLENIAPLCDGWIAWNDTKRTDEWYHEGRIRNLLLAEAKARGADWALCIDPDERYEINTSNKIRELVSQSEHTIWGFHFRELYTVDSYRIDGIWGEKKRWNLFPLHMRQRHPNLRVHSEWAPTNSRYKKVMTDLNLYHFKMIDPINRVERTELYKKIDVEKQFQDIGYDYLMDETTIKLKKIESFQTYYPEYTAPPLLRHARSIL